MERAPCFAQFLDKVSADWLTGWFLQNRLWFMKQARIRRLKKEAAARGARYTKDEGIDDKDDDHVSMEVEGEIVEMRAKKEESEDELEQERKRQRRE